MIALCILLAAVLLVVVFFSIPYSPLTRTFNTDAKKLSEKYGTPQDGVFTEDDIKILPVPVQRYFRFCGFIGKPKMSGMKAQFRHVAFKQGDRSLTVDYSQYNFVAQPQRLALIESSLFGVPFDGYDSYMDGTGGMKGVVGKLVTIFTQKGPDMDKASLVTFLSECLLLPSAALQDYVTWTPIDDSHAKASISCYGITAEGVFTFRQNGGTLTFTTNDRAMTSGNGDVERHQWTAVCGNYQPQNGIMVPMSSQAIWNLPEGDLVYFDSDNTTVTYY